MDDARTTCVIVSSIGRTPSKYGCLNGPISTWALSLPLDLLLEIFRRLESTAVIRCAAACKLWRRAIIGNASFIWPRPDRFLPSLLLGVFHGYGFCDPVCLRRTAGPLQSAFPLSVAAGYTETANSFIPSATIAGKSQGGYGELLSSRDGFILLRGTSWSTGLCLCNPMTRACAFVPNPANRYSSTYILLTGDDLSLPISGSGSDNSLAVQILAVDGRDGFGMIWSKEKRIKYQLFSIMSGGDTGFWGPVRHSVQLQQDFKVLAQDKSTVVCRGIVHWLGASKKDDWHLTWTVALDPHTGRTWATELPVKFHVNNSSLLATTGDGQLSLIRSLIGHQIQVWVLHGDDQWTLQHTVDVQKQLRHCENYTTTKTVLNAFCPRSGYVLAMYGDQEIRIDLESGPSTHLESIGNSMGCHCKPYEMDWSTYVSKMKHF